MRASIGRCPAKPILRLHVQSQLNQTLDLRYVVPFPASLQILKRVLAVFPTVDVRSELTAQFAFSLLRGTVTAEVCVSGLRGHCCSHDSNYDHNGLFGLGEDKYVPKNTLRGDSEISEDGLIAGKVLHPLP